MHLVLFIADFRASTTTFSLLESSAALNKNGSKSEPHGERFSNEVSNMCVLTLAHLAKEHQGAEPVPWLLRLVDAVPV